jgi:hypothetical protein
MEISSGIPFRNPLAGWWKIPDLTIAAFRGYSKDISALMACV